MENLQPEAVPASGGVAAPKIEGFTANRREKIAAFAMYALAYVYILFLQSVSWGPFWQLYFAGFTLGFFALAEYLHRDVPRSRESWIWLGCAAVIFCAVLLKRGNAWSEGQPTVFLHIFAVWWVLSRSDTLLEGESGHLLPLDALDGFVLFPFEQAFLRVRTVFFTLSHLRGNRKGERPNAETVAWSMVMSAAALGLLALSVNLLTSADDGFAGLLEGLTDLFRLEWDYEIDEMLARLLFSLPVGAYLYGLLDGTLRKDKPALRERAAAIAEQMEALRGVPERVWLVLLTLFCALYALFFAVQGQYLFGAFTRTLPDGFVVAEYARQGFFELCKVMGVNFALLWLVTRSSKVDVRQQKTARALCLVLLAESFLLAVVAFSKLALYIDCFGFTPKRLQSTWLVCVLAFGCGCAAWSLVHGNKTFRVWMIFGAVTLSLLCLY